jgi:hypothetical protein
MQPPSNDEAPWKSGLRGARANVLPGLALQAVALALVVGYYFQPAVHAGLAALARERERTGMVFGVVSTGLCGGVFPFLYLHFAPRGPGGSPRYAWAQGAALTVFWAYKGLEVGIWYVIQARMVGTGHDVATIAVKVVLDQFGYCPVLAVPVTAAVYQWVDSRFDGSGLWADVRAGRWYQRRALPVLISNLGVWIPAVALIYALPTPLQLPLQNIILCFYTLVVAHQMRTGS